MDEKRETNAPPNVTAAPQPNITVVPQSVGQQYRDNRKSLLFLIVTRAFVF